MFTELNSVLDISPEECIDGSFIGLSDSNADGTFLIHHFLSFFLKRGQPVCFVGFSQSFSHYNTVSKKLGTDLNVCKDAGIFTYVDGLSSLKNVVMKDLQEDDSFSSLMTNNPSLSHFYSSLKGICKDIIAKAHKYMPVIIIDNLSILLDIGFPTKQVISFVHYLYENTQDLDILEGPVNKGTLVVFLNNGMHNHDEDAQMLWKYIYHMSTMNAEVSGLDSGYCKEVHGKIVVTWKGTGIKMRPKRTMQFKVLDKHVSLFASGTSKAVL